MSKEKNSKPVTEEIPNWVKKTPELLPVWDWWVKDGRSTVTWLPIYPAPPDTSTFFAIIYLFVFILLFLLRIYILRSQVERQTEIEVESS